ncbi:hypothetical protein [Natrinema sp. DC36]|uniref:hypothetical protein n=1 Tax=Natrinema sp. DC36 TaxID=2878680 RepID=UPI001CF03C82|nr:hypothetical protein [Natrinema sp. DC36]
MVDTEDRMWKTALKVGFGTGILILVVLSLVAGSEAAETSLQGVIQIAIMAYGANEGLRYRDQTAPAIASVLLVIGGAYGCYLAWRGNEMFTNFLYLGLVGSGLLGVQVRDVQK